MTRFCGTHYSVRMIFDNNAVTIFAYRVTLERVLYVQRPRFQRQLFLSPPPPGLSLIQLPPLDEARKPVTKEPFPTLANLDD
jgi:hypothetical protein